MGENTILNDQFVIGPGNIDSPGSKVLGPQIGRIVADNVGGRVGFRTRAVVQTFGTASSKAMIPACKEAGPNQSREPRSVYCGGREEVA